MLARCAFTLTLLQFVFTPTVQAQDEYQDRLARIRDVTRNSELVLVWSRPAVVPVDGDACHAIYDLDLLESDVNSRLELGDVSCADQVVGTVRRLSVTTGNFAGTAFEQVVSVWATSDSLVVGRLANPEGLSWSPPEAEFTVEGRFAGRQDARLLTTSGDYFGSDGRDEFAVAFQSETGRIRIQTFGFENGTLNPTPAGWIDDEMVVDDLQAWDVVSGDFDGDGFEEIALAFVRESATSGWVLSTKIYQVGSDGMLSAGPTTEIFPKPSFTYSALDISAAAGDFDVDAALELAVVFTFAQDDPEPDSYMYLLDVDPGTDSLITSDDSRVASDLQNESEIQQINIAAGDMDGDYRDEIVVAEGGSWRAFKVADGLLPESWKTGGGPQPDQFGYSHRFLLLDDMDANGTAEIVLVGSFEDQEPGGEQSLSATVIGLDVDMNPQILGRFENEQAVPSDLLDIHFAVATGDLDADRTRLGSPAHYRKTGVLRPSVVLNAPPVHFDVLDGVAYDLSDCFPANSCGFSSTYTQTSTSALTVTIESHEDWAISANVTIKSPLTTSVTGTYGEKFSFSATDRETIKISTGRLAAGDDWIYANVYDIDYYEYPVFEGDDPAPIGYFIVSIPETAGPLWIEGKNDALLGNLFRQDHEVGNVLSYRLDPPVDLGSDIVVFDPQTVGSTGSSSVSVELSNFAENEASTSWEGGLEVSSKLDISKKVKGVDAGVEVGVKGSYSRSEVTTQTVSVEESLEMRSDFGRLDTPFGTAATYQIVPFAYWTDYGALVVDFRVLVPEAAQSFWQENYGGKTDLGFAMPWRYDTEKGLPLPGGDTDYLRRTRDIVISKPEPTGGDTVAVLARIRNMGLADATDPVVVDFFLGDPSAGGELIGSTSTDTTIASQYSETVSIEWVIPETVVVREAHIFARIGEAGVIPNDVHDNNNVGWAPLLASGFTVTSAETEQPETARSWFVGGGYPNPFDSRTTILVDVPEPAHVKLEVFDSIGRRVAVLGDEAVPAGLRPYFLEANGLSAGVYLYRLSAVSTMHPGILTQETRKLVLVDH